MVRMPFRRKNNQNNVPKEISDYYQAERKQRMGTAWMLSLVAFVLTVLLVLGLFFGGRWVYRQFNDDNAGQPTETAQTNDQQKQQDGSTDDQDNPGTDEGTTQPSSEEDRPTPDNQQGTATDSSQTPQPAAPTTTNNETDATAQNPVTGDTVPNTGPGEVMMVFGVTALLAALLHNIYLRKRAAK